MHTRRNIKYKEKKIKTIKNRKGKKWVTAIQAAVETLDKTGSLLEAKKALRKQALRNALKLFGSVGTL